MKVHGGFGDARGARGKAQQASVCRSRIDGVELCRCCLHQGLQRIGRIMAVEEQHMLQNRAFVFGTQYLGAQSLVAQRMADLRNIDNGGQLLGPQQRHGGHCHAASFHDAKPAGHHHRVVGRAQQHAVAGHQALLHQHIGNAVGFFLQLGISPAHAFGLNAETLTSPFAHMLVEQFHRTVQSLGELQRGQLEEELGLQLGRRQMVSRKGIDMRGVRHGVRHDSDLSGKNRL